MNQIKERLFVAINFSEAVKKQLAEQNQVLKQELIKQNLSGDFSRTENLHLTLAFIGETTRRSAVEKALAAVFSPPPFDLSIGALGRFRRPKGDIWWRKIDAPDALFELAQSIQKELIRQDFAIEKRKFQPHLTIGRRMDAVSAAQFQHLSGLFSPILAPANRVSLMRSQRKNGLLVYSELCGFDLGVN